MSKLTTKLLCLALALCMVLGLAACGKASDKKDDAEKETTATQQSDKTETKLAGTYVLSAAEYEGQTLGKEELDLIGLYDYECYIILEADGTGTLALEGDVDDICWNSQKLWSSADESDSMAFTVNGKTLSVELEGVTLSFTKGQIPAAPQEDEDETDETQPDENETVEASSTTYRLSGATYAGEALGIEELSTLGLTPASCYIVLNTDGTGILCLEGQAMEIAWENGKMWDPANAEDVMPFTLNGNEITVVEDETTLIFTVSAAPTANGDRYVLVYAEMEGEKLTAADLALLGLTEEDCYLDLAEDGTGKLVLMGESMDIEWEEGKLWMPGAPDEIIPYTVNGDEITIDMMGLVLILKKA